MLNVQRFQPTSLWSKLIFTTTVASCLIAVGISWHNYNHLKEVTYDRAIENLAGQIRLAALQYKVSFEEMENDTYFLSRTPPISGIMRAKAGGGWDTVEKSSLKVWKKRLETIFLSILNERPHYTQIRYIGLTDNGRELVRVNREEYGISAVPTKELQEKAKEAYFQKALTLKKGEFYLTDVNYNREFGKIDPTFIPTIRSVLPVFDQKNNISGLIVINANYRDMLLKTMQEIAPKAETYVFNQNGDYLVWAKDNKFKSFHMHGETEAKEWPLLETFQHNAKKESHVSLGEDIYYYVKLQIHKNNASSYIGVVERVKKDDLLKDAYAMRRESMLVSALLILLATGLTALMVGHLTKPLRILTNTITKAKNHRAFLDLPIDQTDEVGEFSRTFKNLVSYFIEEEAKSLAVLDNAIDGIITINEHGIIESCNSACENIFGYKREEMIGNNIKMLMPENHANHHDGYLNRYIESDKATIIGKGREVLARRKSGEAFPIELAISHIRLHDRRLFSGIIRDISERKLAEELRNQLITSLREANDKLKQIAFVDELTGLCNRSQCQKDLDDRISDEVNNCKFALIQIDLDNFKRVNDTLGHAAGDALLHELGTRFTHLQEAFPNFKPYRWGGDEFVAILDREDDFNIQEFCQELTDIVSIPVVIEHATLNPSASLGIAHYPEDAKSLEELMIFADLALYKTKALGRDGFQLFDQSLKENVDREANVEAELRYALERDELELYYQPQVDIKTGTITGIEALIRWNHPRMGVVSPGEFIDIAEKVGLGPDIGRYVMRDAVAAVKQWHEDNIEFGKLSINVSPQHLKRGTFFEDLMSRIDANNVDPKCFVVEILESYTLNDPNMDITNMLVALRERGVCVELDDFGTGYASLSHLTALPLDGLKIDQSFIRQMKHGARENDIVSALITMSKSLGLRVVCEGVQSAEHIELLSAFDMCSIQGYFLAKPMPKNDLTTWIRRWNGNDAIASLTRDRLLKTLETHAVDHQSIEIKKVSSNQE